MTQGEALNILKTGANVFLTGEPGSGKTHTLNAYVAYLRELGGRVAVTASTGIAATHIGGMTIHSWSGIGIKTSLSAEDLDAISSKESVVKRVREAQVLIIDEVSMLSPETLDMVDAVCKTIKGYSQPFGGIQVVLVGDFFQLPPVVKEFKIMSEQRGLFSEPSRAQFCYDSRAWRGAQLVVCYLTEQHRADDEALLTILSNLRRGEIEDEDTFAPFLERSCKNEDVPSGTPMLYTHNAAVDALNDAELHKVRGPERAFVMKSGGSKTLVDHLERGCLSPQTLTLKAGARVMCTKNNIRIGVTNGALGVVERFTDFDSYPVVKLDDGRTLTIEPASWSVEEGGKVLAYIEQIPLRLAWAITVHKSQGMTLDAAAVDLSKTFEYGQGYVALSRVRSLAGLYVLGYNRRTFEVHPSVLEKDSFFRSYSEAAAEQFADLGEELDALHTQFGRSIAHS